MLTRPVPRSPRADGRLARRGLAVAALGVLAASCSSATDSTATSAADTLSGPLTVFASASLTEAFTALGDAFMAAHPTVDVTFNFASSSEIAAQVADGAPVGVLATADAASMQTALDGVVASGGAALTPTRFATNSMAIVVAPGNPKGITGLADLADPDLLVVWCNADAPCGKYAAAVLANAGVAATPASLEENVKGVLSKVTLGEADAGIVYRTDVIAAGAGAEGVEVPADVNIVADYPIVALTGDLAAAFVAFVLGDDGQAILEKFGFGPK